MFTKSAPVRFPLANAACAGLICLNLCRVGNTEDVPSPVNVIATDTPVVALVQNGDGMVVPPYTWTVEANEAEFSVRDLTGGQFPFQINAEALSNSIRIGNDRNIGFGTSTPQRNLHIVNAGDTPSVRFDTTSQVWDIEADGVGFTIVDVTAVTNPLTIVPGSGRIGLGTLAPSTLLHARKAAESGVAETLARFDIADDPTGKLEISNVSSTNGIFHPRLRGTTSAQAVCLTMEGFITDDIGGNPIVSFAGTKLAGGSVVNRPLVAFRNNQTVMARVAANGDMFATSFNPTSSRTMKDKIVDLDTRKASDALHHLTPVEYVYKDDPTAEQRIGFIAEDVPEIVANADRKSVPIMDVLAVVTRVVKDQQQTIDNQQKTIEELMRRLTSLETQMQDGK